MTRRDAQRADTRLDLIALLLLATLLFLPGLGARDLWNPSEPAYGLAVAEMHEAGEWLIPTANGERFLEKPILYFWLARIASLVFGLDEFSLRLPSFLSALVATAYVYLLGRRFGSPFFARAAGLMFITTISIAWSARQIQMDLAATAAVAATVYHGLDALERPRDAAPWAAAALAAGLGGLVRGPVAWVYAAIPLIGAWWGMRPKTLPAARSIAAATITLTAVLATWIAPLVWRGETGVLGESIVRQSFARFLNPWDHVQPWWYYLKYVWIDMAPWALLLPLAAAGTGRRRERRFAWIWLIGTMIFFSLSASKRSTYLMPAAPAVVLLAAGVVESLFGGTLDRVRRTVVLVLLGLAPLALLGLAWSAWDLRARHADYADTLTIAAGAFAIGALTIAVSLMFRGRERRAARSFWIVLAATQVFLGAWLLPQVNPFKSARGFATEVHAVAGDDPVSGYRLWVWRVDYVYYLGRRIGRVPDAARALDIWRDGQRHCMIVEQWKRDEFLQLVGRREPAVRRDVGSKQVDLYCNQKSSTTQPTDPPTPE